MRIAALIVAAGRGVRARGGASGAAPKQHRPIVGVTPLARSLTRFGAHPRIDIVLPVIGADDSDRAADAAAAAISLGARPSALATAVTGGAERQQSVALGLHALADHPTEQRPDLVLIHDAARPFTPVPVIDGVLAALENGAQAACPSLPVADTLRTRALDSDGAPIAGPVQPREGLVRAQTPQGFRFDAIAAAHDRFADTPVTDDAELARLAGLPVVLTEGAEDAFKITGPEDFARAEALVRARMANAAAPRAPVETRTGTGFDVHAFGPNADGSRDHVWLCGLAVPHEDGLKGHSDADVGLHALTDAVLAALSDGDIGAHFPPSDQTWAGAASDQFLAFATNRVRQRGGEVRHLDVTLICERPKIRPHVDQMRARIAEISGISVPRVSVKATTSEQLGFTGRREGIAALAAATITLPDDSA